MVLDEPQYADVTDVQASRFATDFCVSDVEVSPIVFVSGKNAVLTKQDYDVWHERTSEVTFSSHCRWGVA